MKKGILCIGLIISLFFSIHSLARQSGGGGGDDLEGVCKLAGGTWTGSESGNWACCWDNWGCYGCYNGICKMQCRTQRCRRANAIHKTSGEQKRVEGLAPKGMDAPIIPKNAKPGKVPANMNAH